MKEKQKVKDDLAIATSFMKEFTFNRFLSHKRKLRHELSTCKNVFIILSNIYDGTFCKDS